MLSRLSFFACCCRTETDAGHAELFSDFVFGCSRKKRTIAMLHGKCCLSPHKPYSLWSWFRHQSLPSEPVFHRTRRRDNTCKIPQKMLFPFLLQISYSFVFPSSLHPSGKRRTCVKWEKWRLIDYGHPTFISFDQALVAFKYVAIKRRKLTDSKPFAIDEDGCACLMQEFVLLSALVFDWNKKHFQSSGFAFFRGRLSSEASINCYVYVQKNVYQTIPGSRNAE